MYNMSLVEIIVDHFVAKKILPNHQKIWQILTFVIMCKDYSLGST